MTELWPRARAVLARSPTLRRIVAEVRGRRSAATSEAPLDIETKHRGYPVAVVGLGRQGQTIANTLSAIGYELSAVCDIDPEKLKAFGGSVTVTTSVDELVARRPGIVVVSTTAGPRAAIVEQLAGAGVRRILCEKPIATTLADAHRIEAMAERYPLDVKVHTPRNWLPEYGRIADLVQSRQLGDLRRIEMRFKPSGFGNMASHFLPLAFQLTGCHPTAVRSAWFDDSTMIARTSAYADRNGWAECVLAGSVEFRADNVERPVRGPSLISLSFSEGHIFCREGSRPSYAVFDARSGVTTEWSFRDGPITGRSRRAVALSLDRALSQLITGERDRSLEWAVRSVETIVGAQMAHQRRQPIEFPLPADAASTFLFT